MIVETDNGERRGTRGRSAISFEKIEKRWYLVYSVKGTKEVRKVPVKHVKSVKAGTIKGT